MSAGHLPKMSNAAFAGFLRLLLTPLNEAPDPSSELQAYFDYLTHATGGSAGKAGRTETRSGEHAAV